MKKILIIDDNEYLRRLVYIVLSEAGFECVSVDDAKRGLELAESELPNLIISDIVMPDMNGLEFTAAVRENSRIAKIPVMLLTGKNKDVDIKKGYQKGADYYMTKPFTKEQLLYGVNLLLDET